jgi:hypothetical protein
MPQADRKPTTRRRVLALLAAGGIGAVPAIAAASPPRDQLLASLAEPGPLEKLIAEWNECFHAYREEEQDYYTEWLDRVERDILATDAKTPREAVAMLEWARADYVEVNGVDDGDAPNEYLLIVAAFDRALKFLRPVA